MAVPLIAVSWIYCGAPATAALTDVVLGGALAATMFGMFAAPTLTGGAFLFGSGMQKGPAEQASNLAHSFKKGSETKKSEFFSSPAKLKKAKIPVKTESHKSSASPTSKRK